MLKALLRKQLLEVNSWIYVSKKTGKRRTKSGIIRQLVLYTLLFGFVAVLFGGLGMMMLGQMLALDLGWLYFLLMSILAILFGTFGSVFNTYSTLYKAKDNQLLLSMPIPPWMVLTARLSGVWFESWLYESLVFVPAMLLYWIRTPLTVSGILCPLIVWITLSVLILTLSAALGWVVAKISNRLKHKSLLTVLVSLVCIGVYYFFCFTWSSLLEKLLENLVTVGSTIQGSVYPLYVLGKACTGSWGMLLALTAVTLALFALCWLIMSRSFLRMATATEKTVHAEYKRTAVKASTPFAALLRKEARRLFASPTYILNACLGTVMLPIAAVALLIKGSTVRGMMTAILPENLLVLVAAAAISAFSTMNTVSAPSVSLEGKSIWILQSLPVDPWLVLKAKATLHFLLTEIPVLLIAGAISWVFAFSAAETVLLFAAATLSVLLSDLTGLTLNLASPNLHWTNEVIPVKQSLAVGAVLMGGWLLIAALGFLYWLVRNLIAPIPYLLIVAVLFLAADAVLVWLLRTRGAKRFATLR